MGWWEWPTSGLPQGTDIPGATGMALIGQKLPVLSDSFRVMARCRLRGTLLARRSCRTPKAQDANPQSMEVRNP